MSNKTGLSVIVVNYNGGLYLDNLLSSLKGALNGYFYPYEILILDNSSKDNSKKILSRIDKENENVFVTYSSENLGFGKANNFLVKKCNYENVVLLNNDTEIVAIDNILSYLNKNKVLNNEVLTCTLLNKDLTKQENVYSLNISFFKLFINLFLIKNYIKTFFKISSNRLSIKNSYFSGCFLVMSKSIYEKLNGFDHDYYFYQEEADLFLRLEKMSHKKMYFSEDRIIHYGGGGGLISEFSFINYFISLYVLYIKHKRSLFHQGIKYMFLTAFNFRVFLLKLNISIPYSPFYKTYSEGGDLNYRSNKEVLEIHLNALNKLQSFFKKKIKFEDSQ